MKTLLYAVLLALVLGVGCASTPAKPTSPKVFTNTLGMKFLPVPGTKVQFSIWETRMQDYAAYAAANKGVVAEWKKPWKGLYRNSLDWFNVLVKDTHPVTKVSWNDAQAFCAWLTKKEQAEGKLKPGQRYRLPTDAEWSMAVGLGKEKGNTPKEKEQHDTGIRGAEYPWVVRRENGLPRPPKPPGNYNYLAFATSVKDFNGRITLQATPGLVDDFYLTSPVGSFAANQYGIHDLGGNVWERCEDWYDPKEKTGHVLRGASWANHRLGTLKSSARFRGWGPDSRSGRDFGFRCVLTNGSDR